MMALHLKQLLHETLRPIYVPVRFKKKKVAFKQFRRKNDAEEIARDYFDTNYEKIFKAEWPAIRCAMLSRKKYCAVLNNFAHADEYEEELIDSGAYNFIRKLHESAGLKCNEVRKSIKVLTDKADSVPQSQDELNVNDDSNQIVEENLEYLDSELAAYNQLRNVCAGVQAYVYPKRNFTEFVQTVENSLHLSFLLDGSSILPVLALDPRPSDHILDLCAAPGGKLNVIIQALGNSGHVVANDVVSSRTQRIKKVFQQYYPSGSNVGDTVKLVRSDGTAWSSVETECYSKVLVDVPCTNDRKSMYPPETDTDNIFSEARKRERSRLPELQSLLLLNAIQACQVGGTIVYSTCTASSIQNQYVVQYAVQEALQSHNIVCEVEDLSILTSLLKDEFYFQKDIDLGALVLPRLDANFGPTYVCKLRRLS